MRLSLLSALLGPLLFAPPALHVRAGWESSETVVSVTASLDVGCILRTWRIVGVDACLRDGRPHICLVIENAYPVGIVEAVRRPLASHLAELSP